MTGETGAPSGGGRTISVIIAARDAAATLPATLRSLRADRERIAEILLVDDGSGDATSATAVEEARVGGLPLEVIRVAAGNAGAARNVGLDRAAGSFVFFLDADDEVMPGGLRLLLTALCFDPAAGIAVGTAVRRTAGRPDKAKVPHGYIADRQANTEAYLSNRLWPIAIGSALVRRAAALSARFPEDLLYDEDTCYWAALLARCEVAAIAPPVLLYHLDEDRASGRLTKAPRRNFLNAAVALNRLRSGGIDKGAVQRRKAWIALRVARQHLKLGEWTIAAKFLRVAMSHPAYARSWTTFRYSIRMRVGASLRRLSG